MSEKRIFIYGKTHCFRLLAQFSATEMKVEVWNPAGDHVLSSQEIDAIDEFSIGGHFWKKLWQRHEADQSGAYTAVGLRLRP